MPQNPPPIPYEQRLLLYADILGWSRLVHDSEKDATKKSLVEYVIHKFRQELAFDRLPGVATTTGWQFSLASDSFFASSPVSAEYFRDLLIALSALAHSLLRRGIYLRGSLVAGSLFHDREVVVGPAVVTAVQLEKSTCHPRIVVHESVFQYLDEEEHWVYRSEDGVPALDYMRFLYSQRDNPGDALGRDAREILDEVERKIEKELGAGVSLDCRLVKKHLWMKAYLGHLASVDAATIG